MRNVVMQMMTTVNGRLDDPNAWVTGLPDDVYEELDRQYETFDTILVGRTTYEEMLAYWPGAETAEDGSETSRSMARKMKRTGSTSSPTRLRPRRSNGTTRSSCPHTATRTSSLSSTT